MQGEQESEAIINLVNKLVGQIDNRLKGILSYFYVKIFYVKSYFLFN